MPQRSTGLRITFAAALLVAAAIAFSLAVWALAPAAGQNTALWARFNAAAHRPAGPVDGAFVLSGLRADASPAEVERWVTNWDSAVLSGEVAINRNADGSPSVIMRGLRLDGREADGAAKGQRIIENLVLRCDRNGRPLTVQISFMLRGGGPPVEREVDVASGRIIAGQGSLRNLRVKEEPQR